MLVFFYNVTIRFSAEISTFFLILSKLISPMVSPGQYLGGTDSRVNVRAGSGYYQLSVVTISLSVVANSLSVVANSLSVVANSLSVVTNSLSVDHYIN